MSTFHKKVILGKVYHKLPYEFDEMTTKEFELLFLHTIQLNEYEKEKITEGQTQTT